ncbi:hypothetical protein ATCC90586_010586 [Pythium insidiosum]|nr:hypothetical protein ATCC90586_010586 [Pythium insidiosum]
MHSGQHYPRQYGAQQQRAPPAPYPQQQYPQYGQPAGAYPPNAGHPTAYPPASMPQQYPPGYAAGRVMPPPQQPPTNAYGYAPRGTMPPAASPAPGPLQRMGVAPGHMTPAPRGMSTYESQAARWKQGFASKQSGGRQARNADLEAPLVAELCSSIGSSYPSRDALHKLLRHLPNLDHEYLCELLDDKLEDRLWQVQGKALSVLDTLFKSSEAEFFKSYYYFEKRHVLEALCQSKKELLRARADKVFSVIRTFNPPEPVAVDAPAVAEPRDTPSLLPTSPIQTASHAAASPNLMPSMDIPAAIEAPPLTGGSSAFGFLNATAPAPSVVPPQPPSSQVSAFSFISSGPTTGAPAPAPTPTMDVFSTLPAPTPVAGLVVPQEPVATEPEAEEDDAVHDPIHDAFEGLDLDGDDDAQAVDSSPLDGFSTVNGGTMASTSAIKLDASDPVREVIFEIDVPPGPMGLVLDRSISSMAVVQGFVRLPTGERGYLEMHPVLCPGCAIVSINGVNVEEKGLDDVGPMLGSLLASVKVLRFKKLMRGGRTANPADPLVAYVPPPPEEDVEISVKEDGHDGDHDDDDVAEASGSDVFTPRLMAFSEQLDAVERKLSDLVTRDRSNQPIADLKNELAQLHGNVEKIQTQGIDAVIIGANPPANVEAIKQLRSSLVHRADDLARRIQKIAVNGTAPSPLLTGVIGGDSAPIGSPMVSAFGFVGGASSVPPLELGDTSSEPAASVVPPVSTSVSAFSFLQASPGSPVAEPPTSAAVSGFSFLQDTNSPTLARTQAAAPTTVFAGLAVQDPASSSSAAVPSQGSAFSFLSSASPSASPSPASPSAEPPTAFGFLQSQSDDGPPTPPVAPQSSGVSAFSFISS